MRLYAHADIIDMNYGSSSFGKIWQGTLARFPFFMSAVTELAESRVLSLFVI